MNKHNFSLTQIEYVLAVYKYSHFAKAAEACHITQPTLSMQIQKLEQELGVVIFDRTKKPILLTDAGKKIIEQFLVIQNEVNKIDNVLASSQFKKTQGELVVGIIPTIAPYVLPKLLRVIEKKFPSLNLKILELETQKIIDALDSDEIDVGLLATPLKIDKIYEYPLYYEPFYVLCQNNHELAEKKKIKYANLKYDDIWLLEEGHCLRNQVLDVCSIKNSASISRKYNFESSSLETLKNLVDSYGGYTLIPHLAATAYGKNSKLISFDRPIPAREIGLVYRREHFKLELIEAFADCILSSIPEEIKKIRPKDLDIVPV